MLCDHCRERDAVVHLTQIVENAVTQLHLCEKCAAEQGDRDHGRAAAAPAGGLPAGGAAAGGADARRDAARVRLLRRHAARLPRDRPPGLRPLLRRVRARACASCCVACTAAASTWGSATSRRDPSRWPRRDARCASCATSCSARSMPRTVRAGGRAARPDPGARMTPSTSTSRCFPTAGCGGSTPRAPTRTSCSPRASGWRATSWATPSPGARARRGAAARAAAGAGGAGRTVPTPATAACCCGSTSLAAAGPAVAPRAAPGQPGAGRARSRSIRVRAGAAVFLGEQVGVMVNEEDHLRLQALRVRVRRAAARCATAERLDRELGARAAVRVPRRVRLPDGLSRRTPAPGCAPRC